MRNKKGFAERRENKRCQIKGLAFVVMKSDSAEQHGLITDVSKDGLSCRYLEDKEMPVTQASLDIYYQNKRLLTDVPNTTIADFVIPTTESNSLQPMRRRNIQFDNLPAKQMTQLEKLIDYETTHLSDCEDISHNN
jgi:hypothetical protein